MATLTFRVNPEITPVAASSDLVRAIHQSRRHRQEGNLDRALETLAGARPGVRCSRNMPGGPSPSGNSLSAGGSATWAPWSTPRRQAGPPPWCPQAMAGHLRWSPCWECPGGRASLCPDGACGACVPQCQARDRLRGGLALDSGLVIPSGHTVGATDPATPGGRDAFLRSLARAGRIAG